jgi:hypothetical protein
VIEVRDVEGLLQTKEIIDTYLEQGNRRVRLEGTDDAARK